MRRSGEGRSGATLFRQRPQTRHLPPKAPTPRYRPTSPKLRVQGVPWCHLPLPPNPSIPYPTPMHTHTTPAAIVLPAQAGTSPPVKGESRGDAPLARGLGDVPPITQKRPRAGGWGPTNVATQHPLPGEGAGLAPKDDHRMLRSHFNGPIPRRSPAAARCGCRACPALFPFVDFGPSFTEALGLRSARALADTTCSPLSTFPTPPSGAVRPPSRQCLADTTCLPLSTCPSRLNPKLRRVAPGRTSRKKRTAQFKASQSPGEGWNEGDRGERSCRRSLAKGESRGGKPSGKGSGGCAPSH